MPIILGLIAAWFFIIAAIFIFSPGIHIWTTYTYYAWLCQIALCGLYEILMRLANLRQVKENSLFSQNKIPISVLVFRRVGDFFILPSIVYLWISGVMVLFSSSVLFNTYGWVWIIILLILFSLYILKDFLSPWLKRL